MNPFLKVAIIVVVLISILIGGIFIVRSVGGSQFENITYAEFKVMQEESKTKKVIYLFKQDCTYCKAYKPNLTDAAKEADVKVYVLDVTKLNESQAKELETLFQNYLSNGTLGTPTIGVLDNGEIIDAFSGVKTKQETITFFQNNNVTELPKNPFEK